jgi:hypothetical protein
MQDEIERPVRLAGHREDAIDVFVLLHIARRDQFGAERLDEFPQAVLHPRPRGVFVGEMSETHRGPLGMKLLRDGPGDRMIVGDPQHQSLFSGEQTHDGLL